MVCFFEKIRIILKANLLKGRVAKSEGTKSESLAMSAGFHCFQIIIIYGKDV